MCTLKHAWSGAYSGVTHLLGTSSLLEQTGVMCDLCPSSLTCLTTHKTSAHKAYLITS